MSEIIVEMMRYTEDPLETVDIVLDGETFDDCTTDELLPVVYSLLEAGRADLALPIYERVFRGAESMIDTLMLYYAKYGELAIREDAAQDAR